MDSFLVLDQNDRSVSYRDLLSYIEYELGNSLRNKTPLIAPAKGRLSRQVKHMPIKSSIMVESVAESNNHKIEIVAGDRPGLLSTIAHAFFTHEVKIQTAKINTLGKRAEDVFLISGKHGEKLSETTAQALQDSLKESFN